MLLLFVRIYTLSPGPGIFYGQHLRTLLPELADYPDGDALAVFDPDWMRSEAVKAVEGLFVYFDFEGTLNVAFCFLAGYGFETFLPFSELVLLPPQKRPGGRRSCCRRSCRLPSSKRCRRRRGP